MTLDEAIKHAAEVAYEKDQEKQKWERWLENDSDYRAVAEKVSCESCAEEHRQLAEWLKELRVFKSRKGQWLRMSALSEQEDDRYECSHCGNVVHHKSKMDLYTFNNWCGRCGSYNGRS